MTLDLFRVIGFARYVQASTILTSPSVLVSSLMRVSRMKRVRTFARQEPWQLRHLLEGAEFVGDDAALWFPTSAQSCQRRDCLV